MEETTEVGIKKSGWRVVEKRDLGMVGAAAAMARRERSGEGEGELRKKGRREEEKEESVVAYLSRTDGRTDGLTFNPILSSMVPARVMMPVSGH